MSKKKQQQTKDTLTISANQSVKEAQQIHLQPEESFEGIVNNYFSDPLVIKLIKLSLGQVVKIDQVFTYTLCGRKANFNITAMLPIEECLIITKNTNFSLISKVEEPLKIASKQQKKLFALDKLFLEIDKIIENSIGGMAQQIIEDQFDTIKGVLIIGQSGTGKTEILNQINLRYQNSKFIHLNEIEENHKLLDSILQKPPKLLLIDDLQLMTKQAVKCLQRFFDNQYETLIIGTISGIKSFDESLKRTGRFEREIFIELPNHKERCEFFQTFTNMPIEDIKELCYQMSGFTYNDIKCLIREFKLENQQTKEVFRKLLARLNPTGLKDLLADVPEVKWEDIGGYDEIKEEIKRVIEWPLRYPDSFKNIGVEPSKGILLYGPPGCSKTLLARALCNQCNLSFIAVKGPELFSKYVGDSEKAVRELFRKARTCAPCLIFFDEIDAIAPQRQTSTDVSDRVLIQLLTEMDGFESLKNVIVIGATNRPYSIDKALLRPGRFDHLIFIDVPKNDARKAIFEVNFRRMKTSPDLNMEELIERTINYTGAEICQVCREAGLNCLKRKLDAQFVEKEDFEVALKKVKPSVNLLDRQKFLQFQQQAM